MRLKIDWASLIVGRKFTVFALFYFVFVGNFQVQDPGGLYLEGRLNGRFFALRVWGGLYLEGLIPGGAYFRNFTVRSHYTRYLFVVLTYKLSFFSPPLRLPLARPSFLTFSIAFMKSNGTELGQVDRLTNNEPPVVAVGRAGFGELNASPRS